MKTATFGLSLTVSTVEPKDIALAMLKHQAPLKYRVKFFRNAEVVQTLEETSLKDIGAKFAHMVAQFQGGESDFGVANKYQPKRYTPASWGEQREAIG